jgi:antitoxin (DNA-binding transcriptional repressor) of toxin-antitoxin stability system
MRNLQKAFMQTISATELARNTREVLDKVVSLGEIVAIERNSVTIAQIMPSQRSMTAVQALAGLSFAPLSAAQAAAWLADSKADFNNAVRDPWA